MVVLPEDPVTARHPDIRAGSGRVVRDRPSAAATTSGTTIGRRADRSVASTPTAPAARRAGDVVVAVDAGTG